MKFFLIGILDNIREWTLKWAHSAHMAGALFFIAFVESSFFPIPPDILMVAILLINSERWRYYAGITALGSVFGAAFGYAIGWGFYEIVGQRIVDFYNLQETMNLIGARFSQHSFLTVFTAAFTPIPFKIITISAGLFKISFWQMIFASIIGRGLRYFAIAYAIRMFGEKISKVVYRYFGAISIAVVALIVAGFFAVKFLF